MQTAIDRVPSANNNSTNWQHRELSVRIRRWKPTPDTKASPDKFPACFPPPRLPLLNRYNQYQYRRLPPICFVPTAVNLFPPRQLPVCHAVPSPLDTGSFAVSAALPSVPNRSSVSNAGRQLPAAVQYGQCFGSRKRRRQKNYNQQLTKQQWQLGITTTKAEKKLVP